MPQTHVDNGEDCYFPEIGLLVFMIIICEFVRAERSWCKICNNGQKRAETNCV